MAKVPHISKREFDAAERRGEMIANLPTALLNALLADDERSIRLHFRNGTALSIPITSIDEIASVPIEHLRNITPTSLGQLLIFDDADVAIYVPGLLRDLFGAAFAGALGKRGGSARTPAKAAAARKNGKKGGRPTAKSAA